MLYHSNTVDSNTDKMTLSGFLYVGPKNETKKEERREILCQRRHQINGESGRFAVFIGKILGRSTFENTDVHYFRTIRLGANRGYKQE